MTAPDRIRQRADRLKTTKTRPVPAPEGVPGECWEWLGARQREGYGTVNLVVDGRRTSTTAHRLFYMAYVGPIPKGHTVHHRCAFTSCVNPEHLETATQRANIGEMFARKALEADRAGLEADLAAALEAHEATMDAIHDATRQEAL